MATLHGAIIWLWIKDKAKAEVERNTRAAGINERKKERNDERNFVVEPSEKPTKHTS